MFYEEKVGERLDVDRRVDVNKVGGKIGREVGREEEGKIWDMVCVRRRREWNVVDGVVGDLVREVWSDWSVDERRR